MCSTVFLHNLSPCHFWSTSYGKNYCKSIKITDKCIFILILLATVNHVSCHYDKSEIYSVIQKAMPSAM